MSKPFESQEKYKDIIEKIGESFVKMRQSRPLSESAIKRYQEEFDVLNAYHSNAIEGNTFTYDETRLLIKDGVAAVARSMREHNDILGHSRAYWGLYQAVKAKRPITVEFILDIHAKVLQGDGYAGRFRDANVYIGDAVSIAYTAPPASKVPNLLDEYVARTQTELLALLDAISQAEPDWVALFCKLAEHHIEFERIHPFFDGNGRTGRLLLNYELLCLGLLPIHVTMAERARYSAAFGRYEGKERYSTRDSSKYESMAKLLSECELNSMNAWLTMFFGDE